MKKKSLPLAATSQALRAGLAIARDTRKITSAWSRYRKDVVRQTSKASQALLRARIFNKKLQVRAKLLRSNGQSFQEAIAKIAETASKMVTRPNDVPKKASVGS